MNRTPLRDQIQQFYAGRALSPGTEETLKSLILEGRGGGIRRAAVTGRLVWAAAWAASLLLAVTAAYYAGSARGHDAAGGILTPEGLVGTQATVVPDYVAVKFHADWCARCPTIGPVFNELTEKYGTHSILFVTLDLTDETRRKQAEYLTRDLGMEWLWDESHETGVIKLISRSQRRVLTTLTDIEKTPQLERMLAEALQLPPDKHPTDSHS